MTRTTNGWFLGAAAVGLVHAAFSLSWALGSRWLLPTIGEWATDWAARSPTTVPVVLLLITVAKVAGAVVPVLVERGRLPGQRWWRAAEWIGAAGLLLYGLVNAVVAAAVLSGLLTREGPRDEQALWGHAVLWDPLFALWGGLLAVALWRSRVKSDRH